MNYSKDSNKKKLKEQQSNRKKKKNRVGLVLFRVIFVSLLILLFAGVGAGMGIFAGIIRSTPPIDVSAIAPEGFASILYDDENKEIDRLSGEEANRQWANIEDIPDHLENAFVAIEDTRFYQHNGIDLQSIMRALVVNLKAGGISEGGSTLTQQLIKNNVLTAEQTIIRKIQEQYMALMLEKELTDKYGKKQAKQIILENYLNTINLGNGAFGVQAAALAYFNKDVKDITASESAVLAAIAPNPSKFDPSRYPENNEGRRTFILKMMNDQGYISDDELKTAQADDVYTNIKLINDTTKSSFNSYFVDAVIDQVVEDLMEKYDYDKQTAQNQIYRNGLQIYTTQNTKMQNTVESEMLNPENFPTEDFAVELSYTVSVMHPNGEQEHFFVPKYNTPDKNWGVTLHKTEEAAKQYAEQFKAEKMKEGDKVIAERMNLVPQPQASFVIEDYRTGEIKALSGGRGEKQGDRTFNRAIRGTRSPGSTFKPLAAYAPAIDTAGYTPATVIDDVPFTIKEAYPKPYTPNNWYAHSGRSDWYWGLSTVRDGIEWSMNILAVKTVYDIGIPTSFEYLKNFGFTTIDDSDKGYSLPLGGLTKGVSNFELTAAYSTIGNGGVYKKPILYTKVLDRNGNVILENTNTESRTVIKETTAFLLTNMMEDVIKSGTGTKARFTKFNMPISGKTGTAQRSKDLWFVGYTPYYTAGIWTGYDTEIPLRNQSYHLKLWKKIMEPLHENLPYKEFAQPSGITQAYICQESGQLATDLCKNDPRGSRAKWEYFAVGTAPTEKCTVHISERICKDSDLFAREGYCPEDSIENRVFIKRPEDMRLDYEALDAVTLSRIVDTKYEIPPSMEGEYCNVHGPGMEEEEDKPILDLLDLFPDFGNNNKKDNENNDATPENTSDSNGSSLDDFLTLPE